VKNCAKSMNIAEEIVGMCPTHCMSYDGSTLKINDKDCNRCMHCITRCQRPCAPARERRDHSARRQGPIVTGALMSWVIVPFMKP